MYKHIHLYIIVFLLGLTSCKNDKKENETILKDTKTETKVSETRTSSTTPNTKVKVKLSPRNDSNVEATVIIKQEKGVVSMIAALKGLSKEKYSIFFHQNADCSSNDKKMKDSNGYIGNLYADANGKSTFSFNTKDWCIDCGDSKKDLLEKIIIVREGAFNENDPVFGTIVSCGKIDK